MMLAAVMAAMIAVSRHADPRDRLDGSDVVCDSSMISPSAHALSDREKFPVYLGNFSLVEC
jgi:hypothetical protein